MENGMISRTKVDAERWDSAALTSIKQFVKGKIVVAKVACMNPDSGVYQVWLYKQATVEDKVNY